MHNIAMRSHRDIIRDIGHDELVALTKASIHTVRSWDQRKSIPVKYWQVLIGTDHCTADELIAAKANAA